MYKNSDVLKNDIFICQKTFYSCRCFCSHWNYKSGFSKNSFVLIKADIDLDNYDLSKGYLVNITSVPESESQFFLITKKISEEFEQTLMEML